MQVRIKSNATANYAKGIWERGIPDKNFISLLAQLHGKLVEVETKHLFDDQFNIVDGPRIHSEDVCEIINDERINRAKCGYCGKHHEMQEMPETVGGLKTIVCPNCQKAGHVRPFFVIVPHRLSGQRIRYSGDLDKIKDLPLLPYREGDNLLGF